VITGAAQTREILEQRARILAVPLKDSVMPVGLLQLVTFSLGDGLYGVEDTHVHGVGQLGRVTPIPGAPSAIAGITMHLGDLLTVVDLRLLLGASPSESDACAFLLILADGHAQLGLMVKAFGDMATAGLDEVPLAPTAASEHGSSLIRGMTHGGVIVINTAGLLAHPDVNANKSEQQDS